LLKGRLGGRIDVMVAGTRHLGTHPQPLQIVVAALWRHVLSAGLLGDPACNDRARPQATTRCWSLHRLSQLLQLLGREQPRPGRRLRGQASIPDALGVVAMHDAPSIGRVQADEVGGIGNRFAISHQGEQLPAAGFD
jgi:hypothetical protein